MNLIELLGGSAAGQTALLAAAGALVYWLKDIPGQIIAWLKRFVISTLTVDSRDEFLFAALVEYMDSHPDLRGTNQFTARSVRRGSAYQNVEEDLRNGQPPKAYLSPGEGLHFVWVQGKLVWLTRDIQVGTTVFE
jgi:chaperone BCS1